MFFLCRAARYAVSVSIVFAITAFSAVAAEDMDYRLKAEKVAEGTYVFIGATEYLTRENGGNIVNTSFIVTDDGVVVIDSGPSKRYGEQMRQAITAITDKPLIITYNTHHHPDHYLGNQIFADKPIAALAKTIEEIRENGEMLAENMYRLAGDWMLGTESVTPRQTIDYTTKTIGGHELLFLPLSGHTEADLAIYDAKTGTLFAGDLVFYNRTLATPSATIENWIPSLERLRGVSYKKMVPGHGPVVPDARGIDQTKDYLLWLDKTLHKAANEGMEMTEVMALPLPARFEKIDMARDEFIRTVNNLYPKVENETLPLAGTPGG
jgi:quinoprotein relay system zinc metallohydrolase 1